MITCPSFRVENRCPQHALTLGLPGMQGTDYLMTQIHSTKPDNDDSQTRKDHWACLRDLRTKKRRIHPKEVGKTAMLVFFTRPTKYGSNCKFCTDHEKAPAFGLMLSVQTAASTESTLYMLSLHKLAMLRKHKDYASWLTLVFNLFDEKFVLEEDLEGHFCVRGLGSDSMTKLPTELSELLIWNTHMKRGVFSFESGQAPVYDDKTTCGQSASPTQRRNMAALAYAGVCQCLDASNPTDAGWKRLTLVRLLLGLPTTTYARVSAAESGAAAVAAVEAVEAGSGVEDTVSDTLSFSSLTQTPEYESMKRKSNPLKKISRHRFLSCLRQPCRSSEIETYCCLSGGTVASRLREEKMFLEKASTDIRNARRLLFRAKRGHDIMCAGEYPVSSAASTESTTPYTFKGYEQQVSWSGSTTEAAASSTTDSAADCTYDPKQCPICFGPHENMVFVGPSHTKNIHTERFCHACAVMVCEPFAKKCPLCRVYVTGSKTNEPISE